MTRTMTRTTDIETIEQQAARWVVKRDKATWSEADQAELDAWIAQRIEHRIAFIRLETAWAKCARLRVWGAGVPAV